MASSKDTAKSIKSWRSDINGARCKDYRYLSGLLEKYQKHRRPKDLMLFQQQLQKSRHKTASFNVNKPVIEFPAALPISQRRNEIKDLISKHQVVIVAGETGSGKTTQLPKICLELGLGCRGLIGHTQPRRLAARTIASRIASELDTQLGETVGYQVRFKNLTHAKTQIKLMTDGILLTEFQNDRFLSRYEVLIIDEAHERSLNIDILLGLLKPLCKKRPDLKIIITSATIDQEKFAKHFAKNNVPAPIIEVSGRTYPVEVLYQPIDESDLSLENNITSSITEIIQGEQKGLYKAQGDILVFCSGERDIRAAADALRKARLNINILPLYSRLSIAEQNKVFQPSPKRKVVLATNVAETSVTVPNIAYVIDPGYARISRYSFRSKTQRLPIEEISQASANQRMGRCGRVANGVCIRLYSEDNFNARAEFTPAEILRSNLASVILQMRRIGIKKIHEFDFLDRPDPRLLNDGIKLLQELNAVDDSQNLTTIGKQLSAIPVDPKYARILVEANKLNCLNDALILVSVLSIQDPRERPADFRQKADENHRLIQHPQSDFFSYLYLWQLIKNQRELLSNREFKQYCHSHFLSIARIFEWKELYRQLSGLCKEQNWTIKPWKKLILPKAKIKQENLKSKTEFDQRYISLHKALLAGLLSNIARKSKATKAGKTYHNKNSKTTEPDYLASRNRKVHLFPGSGLSKRSGKQLADWVIAAELLETSKTFLLTVAEIEADWIIDAAQHLCKYSYAEPYYSARAGKVFAKRKSLLSGLVLRENERVNYTSIDPQLARELFIRSGLVDKKYRYKARNSKNPGFSQHNHKLINEIRAIENKTRKQDLLVDDETIFSLYAKKIPDSVVCRASFEKWYRSLSKEDAQAFFFREDELLVKHLNADEISQFPEYISINSKRLQLQYNFDPGTETDGVTMIIPHTLLELIPEASATWLVPGLLHEKCTALLKSLPKQKRKLLVPITNTVSTLLPHLKPAQQSLEQALCQQVQRTTGIQIKPDELDQEKLDPYYLMNYRVVKADGSMLAQGRNLTALKQRYADTVKSSMTSNSGKPAHAFDIHGITSWNFGELPQSFNYTHQGMQITAYPMLQVQADGSISRLLAYNSALANYFTKQSLIALSKLQNIHGNQKQSVRYLQKELFKKKVKRPTQANQSLAAQLSSMKDARKDSDDDHAIWIQPVIDAALWTSCFAHLDKLPHNEETYKKALINSRQWVKHALELEKALSSAFEKRDRIHSQLKSISLVNPKIQTALEDIKQQLDELFADKLLTYTDLTQVKQYPRYLEAIEYRIDKLNLKNSMENDTQHLYEIQAKFRSSLERELAELNNSVNSRALLGLDALFYLKPKFLEFAFFLQEWRVSIFAQQLKTKIPVSYKRVLKAAKEIL